MTSHINFTKLEVESGHSWPRYRRHGLAIAIYFTTLQVSLSGRKQSGGRGATVSFFLVSFIQVCRLPALYPNVSSVFFFPGFFSYRFNISASM